MNRPNGCSNSGRPATSSHCWLSSRLLGCTFTDADDQTGVEPVVVLSYGAWQRRFDGDAGILGRAIRLDGRTATVIVVMPRDFEYPLFWGSIRSLATVRGVGRTAAKSRKQLPS